MEPCFVFFWKLTFWYFKNFQSKILDVAIDIFYGHAKSKREIICISAYTKMRNNNQLRDFWILHCSPSQIRKFVFFTQSKIHNISGWFFAYGYNRISHDYLHAWFFSDFFETLKCQFQIYLKNRLHGAREPKRRTRGVVAFLELYWPYWPFFYMINIPSRVYSWKN
jgi:hypothetical protein